MIVIQKIKKIENGYETFWSLSDEQINYLLTFAINTLVKEGAVSIEMKQEEDERQQQLDFLEETEPEEMGTA